MNSSAAVRAARTGGNESKLNIAIINQQAIGRPVPILWLLLTIASKVVRRRGVVNFGVRV